MHRLLLVVSGIGMFVLLFFPLWRIELDAPQYPEGLVLLIHPSGLGGDVEIVNGLNHYIGMKTLHTEDFVEFVILPYAIMAFGALFILAAALNKRLLTSTVIIGYLLFCVISMIDFWKWEYDYGHNLDPNAAIQVPGMSYQPPLIGFKQLLNFGAYSIPDIGGWIFAGVALLLFFLLLDSNRWFRKVKSIPALAFALLFTVGMSGCASGPEPIIIGKDQCAFCKMTITDARFASELVTPKGRVFKFDDILCAKDYVDEHRSEGLDTSGVYVQLFIAPHDLVPVSQVYLHASKHFNSPMRGNVGAFRNETEAQDYKAQYPGSPGDWESLR